MLIIIILLLLFYLFFKRKRKLKFPNINILLCILLIFIYLTSDSKGTITMTLEGDYDNIDTDITKELITQQLEEKLGRDISDTDITLEKGSIIIKLKTNTIDSDLSKLEDLETLNVNEIGNKVVPRNVLRGNTDSVSIGEPETQAKTLCTSADILNAKTFLDTNKFIEDTCKVDECDTNYVPNDDKTACELANTSCLSEEECRQVAANLGLKLGGRVSESLEYPFSGNYTIKGLYAYMETGIAFFGKGGTPDEMISSLRHDVFASSHAVLSSLGT